MKKEIRSENVYEHKITGTKNFSVFIANDGREFKGKDAKKLCLEWDEKLRKESIFLTLPKIEIPDVYLLSGFPDVFYYVGTKDELEVVKELLGYGRKAYIEVNDIEYHNNEFSELTVENWIGCLWEDGGDFRDTMHFYTLDYVKSLLKEILE